MSSKETQQSAKSLLRQIREVRRNLHQFQDVLQAYDQTPDISITNRSQSSPKSNYLTSNRTSQPTYLFQDNNNLKSRNVNNDKSYDNSIDSYLGLKTSKNQNKPKDNNDSFHYLSSNDERVNNSRNRSNGSVHSKEREMEKQEILNKDQKRSREKRRHHDIEDDYKHKTDSRKESKKDKSHHSHKSEKKKHSHHKYRHMYSDNYSYSEYDDSDERSLVTFSEIEENLFSSETLEEIDKYQPNTKKEEKEKSAKVRKEKGYEPEDRNTKKEKRDKRKKEKSYTSRSAVPKTALSSDTDVERTIRRTEKYRKSPMYLDNEKDDKKRDKKAKAKEDDKKGLIKAIQLARQFQEKKAKVTGKHSATTPQGKTPKTQTQVSDLDSYEITSQSGSINRKPHSYNQDDEGYSPSYGLDSSIISPKNASNKASQIQQNSHKKNSSQQKPSKNKKNKSKYDDGDPLQYVEATIEEISESQYSSSVVFIPPQPDTIPTSPNKQQRNKPRKVPNKKNKPNKQEVQEESSGLQAIHDRINDLNLSSTTSSELNKNNEQNKNESAIDIDDLLPSSGFINELKTPSNVSEIRDFTSNDEANADNNNENEEEDIDLNASEFNSNLEENTQEDEDMNENLEENTQEEDENEELEDYSDILKEEEQEFEERNEEDLDENNNENEEEENNEEGEEEKNEEGEEEKNENEEEEENNEEGEEEKNENEEEENNEEGEEEKNENNAEEELQNTENENQIEEEEEEAEEEEEEEAETEEVVLIDDIGVQTTFSNAPLENNEEEEGNQERNTEQIEDEIADLDDDFLKDDDLDDIDVNIDDHPDLKEDENLNAEESLNEEELSMLLKQMNEEEDLLSDNDNIDSSQLEQYLKEGAENQD